MDSKPVYTAREPRIGLSTWTVGDILEMSRLLALPLMAVVIGVLACGTTATESPPGPAQASQAVRSPTGVPPSDATAVSSPAGVSLATPAAGPTAVPASTPMSQSAAAAPDVTTAPDSATAPASSPLPNSTPAPTLVPTVAPTAAPPRAAIIVDQPEVGTTVGKTVPHFEFALIDGTKRSTAQLASQGRPVFLFFFATW